MARKRVAGWRGTRRRDVSAGQRGDGSTSLGVLLLNGIVAAVVAAIVTGVFGLLAQNTEHKEADRRAKVEVYLSTVDAAVRFGEAREAAQSDPAALAAAQSDWDAAFWKSFAYSTVLENGGVLHGLSMLRESVESSEDRAALNRAVATFTVTLCEAVSPGGDCPPY